MRHPDTGKAIITRDPVSYQIDRDIIRLRSQGQTLDQIHIWLEKKRGKTIPRQSVWFRYKRALNRTSAELDTIVPQMRAQQLDRLDFMIDKMAQEYENSEDVPLALVDRMDRLIQLQNKILGIGNTPNMLEIKNTSGEADWRSLMGKDLRETRRQVNWAENLLLPEGERAGEALALDGDGEDG